MANENEVAELQKYLNDGDYKMLLSFCVEPKAWADISKLKLKKGKMFQIMKDLKIINALAFSDGKYYAAPYTQEYLK
jgi:hypothetical protein